MRILPYDKSLAGVWDDFVCGSRNGTFILQRRYMDYHADRFPDASLLLYDSHERLVALFPATIKDDCVYSHSGLTYGGWILGPSKPDAVQLLEAWRLMEAEYVSRGCVTLLYKAIPYIYHKYPSDEDLYCLFRLGAALEACYISSVVDLCSPLKFSAGAHRHVNKAASFGLAVERSDDFAVFWTVLEERLHDRYGVKPVHSLQEIQMLHHIFPDEIKLWIVKNADGEVVAGTVLYLCGSVVKAQYIASTVSGREFNALDYLFSRLIQIYSAEGFRYFDLGHSCENCGHVLNIGLITQKSGYGGRGVVNNIYRLSLK